MCKPFALIITLWCCAQAAAAQSHHKVKAGQTAAQIARRYRVSVDNLLAANALSRRDVIRPGQHLEVPATGVVYVRAGDTLARIAKQRGTTIKALMKRNHLKANEMLQIGQLLYMPGAKAARLRSSTQRRWGRPKQSGTASFLRTYPLRKRRIRLTNKRGAVLASARRQLRPFFRDTRSGHSRLPHRRLVRVLARISDHFGGRRIQVVSGYRRAGRFTSRHSRHTKGRAIDIRIPGVPNTALRDYCRSLSKVGCGYYPNSSFVHVDVRDSSAYWVDVSGPGQKPRYVNATSYRPGEAKRGQKADASEIAESGGELSPGTSAAKKPQPKVLRKDLSQPVVKDALQPTDSTPS